MRDLHGTWGEKTRLTWFRQDTGIILVSHSALAVVAPDTFAVGAWAVERNTSVNMGSESYDDSNV